MAALLVLGPRVLPEYRDPDAGRLDLSERGACRSSRCWRCIFGLKQIAQDGVSAGCRSRAIVVGLVDRRACGSAGSRRLADPMIDVCAVPHPRLQRRARRQLPGDLRRRRLLPVRRPVPAAGRRAVAAAGGPLVAALGDRVHRRVAAGAAHRRPCQPGAPDRRRARPGGRRAAAADPGRDVRRRCGALVVASVVISLGLAPVFGLTTELIVGSAPPERAGAASGISETGAELGGALGIAGARQHRRRDLPRPGR